MMTVRFISRRTGRQIKSATIDETIIPISKRRALMEVCDDYVNGLFVFNDTFYELSEISATVKPLTDLTEREKIALLTQSGIYKSAAERAVKEDMVVFYLDNNDGMKDYFATLYNESNVKIKKHAWNRLDKVDYFDEYGNFLGAYRYDYFV